MILQMGKPLISINKGPVAFAPTGDQWTSLDIYQMRDGDSVLIGEYNPFADSLTWFEDESNLFEGI